MRRARSAALVVLATATLLAGCTGPAPAPPAPPSFTLGAGSWQGNDLNFSITAATTPTDVAPGDLSYIVTTSAGGVYFTGLAGSQTTAGHTVTVAFEDATTPGKVTALDGFLVNVAPPGGHPLSGGSFQLLYKGDIVATAAIP